MRMSQNGLNLVKAFEGCLKRGADGKYRAYYCPAGVLTIGWGHTNHHGRRFDASAVWTRAECDAALEEDITGHEEIVSRLVKISANQNQGDALISFAYNCGEGNFAKSTLLRRLNAGDFEGAAAEFHKWTRGGGKVQPGLVRRRASESLLFQGITDADYDGRPDAVQPEHVEEARIDSPMPQGVDSPDPAPGSVPTNSRIVEGAEKQGQVGLWTMLAGGFTYAGKWLSEQFDWARSLAYDLGPWLKPAIAFAGEHVLLLVVAAGAVVLFQAHKIRAARIEDHQTGKTAT